MTGTHQRRLQHLLWRAGFGPSISDLKEYGNLSLPAVVDTLFRKSASPDFITINPKFDVEAIHRKGLTMEELRVIRNESINGLKKLNLSWLLKMARSDKQLLEKMTLFWHGHFACVNHSYKHVELYLNTLHKHALGNFATMLKEVAKEPAMLTFLNNRQNRKQQPNENFARELLELFTLGIGNYSEKDIKEAARAFTGWSYSENGDFEVQERFHDYEIKHFMGKSGNFGGEDIIDIILENKQTARFISEKVYVFLVSEEINERHIDQITDAFYDSSYEISVLLKEIFNSEWFYDDAIIGNRIKSPVELIVSFTRKFGITYEDPAPLLYIQRLLGQVLLQPPNVAGWNYGRNWIDSSSLLARMQFAKFIVRGAVIDIKAKSDDSKEMEEVMQMMEDINENRFRKVRAKLNIKDYMDRYAKLPRDKMTEEIEAYLLQCSLNSGAVKVLRETEQNAQKLLEEYSLQVLSLPEYQLC
ncbi:MAG: DUF1800 domain-containing protein [Chitinophagales bacterium]|nr:DUF1800 domain-containing protein [Chitinophagales bacterium]